MLSHCLNCNITIENIDMFLYDHNNMITLIDYMIDNNNDCEK